MQNESRPTYKLYEIHPRIPQLKAWDLVKPKIMKHEMLVVNDKNNVEFYKKNKTKKTSNPDLLYFTFYRYHSLYLDFNIH